MFQFHGMTGQTYLADPQDEAAVRLLHDYTNGILRAKTFYALLFGAVIVFLLFGGLLDSINPLDGGIAGAINLPLLLVAGWILLRAVLVASKALLSKQLEQAVAEGRIVWLSEPCWKAIKHLTTTHEVECFVPHYSATPEDFIAIKHVAAAYWRGIVDPGYFVRTIRPALETVRDHMKAAQQAEQRAFIVAITTA